MQKFIKIWKAESRGATQTSWLESRHSFSFGNYYNPERVNFSDLVVINDDIVESGQGFATHGHRDMEILTYVLSGDLHHKDSMGKDFRLRAGDSQVMSAGKGITHSEYNASEDNLVHFLQIWILPSTKGLKPSYSQKFFPNKEKEEGLCLIASPDSRDGSLPINQDAFVYSTILNPGATRSYLVKPERYAYVQVARGSLKINDVFMHSGDGIEVTEECKLTFSEGEKAELIIFDLRAV